MTARKIDQLLMGIGALLIVFSSYQLFFLPLSNVPAAISVANFSATSATVKIKSAIGLDWLDAFTGGQLVENQLIYTDEHSSANITFLRGGSLKLGEKSLIRLKTSAGLPGLSIERGLITARLEGSEPLVVEMDGQQVILSSSDAEVQFSFDGKRGEIGVLNGEVKVKVGPKEEKLTKEVALEISREELKRQPISFLLTAPEIGRVFYHAEAEFPVSFSWQPEVAATLLIATRHDFSDAHQYLKNKVNLPAGSYFWRVESEAGLSLIGSFKITQEMPPALLRPLTGDQVKLVVTENSPTQLLLQWQGDEEHYQVEWENEKYHAEVVRGNSYLLNISKSGSLKWRVKIENTNRPDAIYSDWQEVVVKVEPYPMAPKMMSPDQIEIQSYVWPADAIELKWDSFHAVELEIQLPDGRISNEQMTAASYLFKPSLAGKHLWRARAKDQYDRLSTWSAWREFLLIDLSKDKFAAGFQRIQINKPGQEVTFAWSGNGSEVHVFELSAEESFGQIISRQEVTGDLARVVIPDIGTYYWRSRQLKPDGTVTFSTPKKVIIEPGPPPAKPHKLPDMEVPLELKPLQKTSSWSLWNFVFSSAYAADGAGVVRVDLPPSADAQGFVVRIYQDPDLQELMLEKKVKSHTFEWGEARPGTYYLQYALVDHWGRQSEFSDISTLTVKSIESEPQSTDPASTVAAPLLKLASPIRAATVVLSELYFKWSDMGLGVFYQLQVSDSRDFVNLLLDKKVKTNHFNWQQATISPGLYFWRVIATDQTGTMTISNSGRFILQPPVEKLIIAEQPLPPTHLLRKNLQLRVSLAWSPAMDAYAFKHDGQSGEIAGKTFNSWELKGTKFYTHWVLNAELLRQSGKVFGEERYLFQRTWMDAAYGWSYHPDHKFYLGAGLGQTQGMKYLINNEQVETQALVAWNYGPAFRSYHTISQSLFLQNKLSYLLGEIDQWEISSEFIRQFHGLYLLAGLNYAQRHYAGESGEQSSLRLNVGIGKEF